MILSRWRRLETREPRRGAEGYRLYAIGDVHGRLDLLNGLLAQIAADHQARGGTVQPLLVFLGDLIDRGPHSRQVVERVPRQVAERVCRYVTEEHVRQIPVTTCKYVREERVEPYEVRVCKMECRKEVVQVPRTVVKKVPVTYTYRVPRTVVTRVPIDPCG